MFRPVRMSTPSIPQFTSPFSPFSSGSHSTGMAPSQTVGLDTLAEGSQYVLEQLQLSRDAAGSGAGDGAPSTSLRNSMSHTKDQPPFDNEKNQSTGSGFRDALQRDPLVEARSAIRKTSSSAPVRRRISRACDQCNQLRTKCDGQHPCAHCIGRLSLFLRCRR